MNRASMTDFTVRVLILHPEEKKFTDWAPCLEALTLSVQNWGNALPGPAVLALRTLKGEPYGTLTFGPEKVVEVPNPEAPEPKKEGT